MTWVYLPNSASSAEPAAGSSPPAGSSGGKRSATSRRTRTASESSAPGSERATSTTPPSGATRERSTAGLFDTAYESCLRDFLVSHSRLPGHGEAPTTRATSGRTRRGSSRKSSRRSSSSKTSPVSCLPPPGATSATSSPTWPRSGSMRNGSVSARRSVERPTVATASGSWATPQAGFATSGYTVDPAKRSSRVGSNNRRGHDGNELLRQAHEAESFPTPCATDHKGSSKPGQRRRQLSERIEQPSPYKHPFPTPAATSYGSSGNGTGNNKASRGRPSLARMAQIPTPCATRGGKISLAAQGKFPTPTVGDSRSAGSRSLPSSEAHSGTSLSDFVLQAEGIKRGSRSRRGRLNPRWVEWLMGWPIGWTALEPLGTDRFREWQRQHACFSAELTER